MVCGVKLLAISSLKNDASKVFKGKVYLINGPNNEFLDPKMVLDLVFDGFSCISIVYIMQNPKLPDIFRIFENIRQKRANFCRKWVLKLKIAISQKHIFK